MSPSDITALIEKWMDILSLSDWHLEWVWAEDIDNIDGSAEIICSNATKEAVLGIRKDIKEQELEKVILHELVHMLLAPLDDAIDAYASSGQDEMKDETYAVICNVEESVVDKIAKLLYKKIAEKEIPVVEFHEGGSNE